MTRETREDVDMDIRRKHRSDCEHFYVITAQVGSSIQIELGQIAGSAKCMRGGVGMGTTVLYMERKFLDKGPEAPCREKPWRSPGSNLKGRSGLCHSEFLDSLIFRQTNKSIWGSSWEKVHNVLNFNFVFH